MGEGNIHCGNECWMLEQMGKNNDKNQKMLHGKQSVVACAVLHKKRFFSKKKIRVIIKE